MLKYSIKAHLPNKLNNIQFDELYVAKDKSFISGISDYYTDLIDGETVSISSPYINGKAQAQLRCVTVTRQGYITTYEKYPFKTIQHIDADDNSIDYIEYNGSYYYNFKDNNFDGVLIDGFFYDRHYDNTVTIPTKHWIENGSVMIKGIKYDVDMNLVSNSNYSNGYEFPTVKNSETDEILEKIDGKSIVISDYEYSKWKKCFKFTIQNHEPEPLNAISATTAMYFPFVQYSGETYPIQDIVTTYQDENGGEYTASTYGVLITDEDGSQQVYPLSGDSGDDIVIDSVETFNEYDPSVNTIKIKGIEYPVNYMLQASEYGIYILLYSDYTLNDFMNPGDVVDAEIYENHKAEVLSGINGSFVVYVNGNQYSVESNLCDYITLDNEDFIVTYINDDKTNGYITIDDENIYLTFNYDANGVRKAIHASNLYNLSGDNVVYSEQQSAFTVNEVSGITIGNHKYAITKDDFVSVENDENSTEEAKYVCLIPQITTYRYVVTNLFGANAIVCRPFLQTPSVELDPMTAEQAEIVNNNIISNFNDVNFILKSTMFGNEILKPENYAVEAFYSDHPFSIADFDDFKNSLQISKITNYLTLPINLSLDADSSLLKDDIITHEFINDKFNSVVNDVVDMEKDIYYPCYRKYEDGNLTYLPISEIKFNLHFRTRSMDSWKVIQDDTEDLGKITLSGNTYSTPYYLNADKSNWFITDYYDYKWQLESDYNVDFCNKLQMSSDLIGLLNFTNDDVKYTKSKISKSFLRLSFYSTPNPHTQMLMATSTIFMDSQSLQQKYLKNLSSANCMFKTIDSQYNSAATTSNTINVLSEKCEYADDGTYKVILDDERRLSSQFTVRNKYQTNNSSESFYLYLFKDYSTKLRENTLYMKVDFCHAGTGVVIPFILPTKSEDNESPLYLNSPEDLMELKEGISLANLYDRLYIPIKVIYDDVNKRYCYYLPNTLVSNNYLGEDDESIMLFNLFELKLKNEAID